MIHVVGGIDILLLLNRVETTPRLYREVLICSPFIDDEQIRRLTRIWKILASAGCGLKIVTDPATCQRLVRQFEFSSGGTPLLISKPRLHAKTYLCFGRDRRRDEGIV